MNDMGAYKLMLCLVSKSLREGDYRKKEFSKKSNGNL